MTHGKCDCMILFFQIADHFLIYERSLLNLSFFINTINFNFYLPTIKNGFTVALFYLLIIYRLSTDYKKMALDGQTWSRQFTTDKFETEISKLLKY